LEKYLFFYLKTGGGHLAPAKAVAEQIQSKKKSDIEIILADGLDKSNIFLRIIIENGYRTAVNNAAWTYELLYAVNKLKNIAKLTASLVSFLLKNKLEEYILQVKPEKIILFHFFLIKPVYQILRANNLSIPVVIVVTDPFTAHPIWFINKDLKFIVFSNLLKEKCIKMGIGSEKIKVFPFVISQKFSDMLTRQNTMKLKNELGFREDSKVILILGGGEGLPKGIKILKKILIKGLDAEIAVVCGRNLKMFTYLQKLVTKFNIRNIKVYGYVDFVHSLISISDVVVTKCGASTFMEVLLAGKVQVISDYIWEQEKGNMEFVCNAEMGILEKKVNRIPDILNRLLNDREYYDYITSNIRKASLINGAGLVSEYILNEI